MVTRKKGGGRKPAGSTKVMLRIKPEMRDSLQALADQHQHKDDGEGNLSGEIKNALQDWVDLYATPRLHNSALGSAVRVLADYIEQLTERKWTDDPLTRELVRDHLTSLVAHLMPKEPVDIPADLKEAAAFRLQLLIHATTSLGSPRPFMGTVIIDDVGLARFLSDLSRRLGIGRGPKIETRPELVARREQQEREKGN